ncbi:MAG: sulfatase-like hydrolase/transferase [bacterium]|nr:sulfatase-like hydrolase/transferase [bacterium]
MNIVFIMTDTQNKSMVGAYGQPSVDTPNLDRLAETGIRFDRAYTACPVCTPARGAIFSGLHPQINGAWCNNITPHANIPLMGTLFQERGYRAGYTGKWHLEGAGYFGNGIPDGGFEPDWWYDGKCYGDDIGPDLFSQYRTCKTADELRAAGFTEANIWGHRVADRAIDFLQTIRSDPFVLVVSFDEPHGPFVTPPEYWEQFPPENIPKPPNYNAPVDNKPELQQIHHRQNGAPSWPAFQATKQRHFACNSYIDREIGRVIDTATHNDDTAIIYTSDHGDMNGAHGLRSKGPMMYEEICNIPLIVRLPDGPSGAVSNALVSHLDLLPTMLDLAGKDIPKNLHGKSLAPVLNDPNARVNDHIMINFNRFAINHHQYGAFYPIRCLTDGRYKLAVNLFDTDELYDLETDPYETTNRIDDEALQEIRNDLHARLLDEMDQIRDPFRTFHWGDRPWNKIREPYYWAENRNIGG